MGLIKLDQVLSAECSNCREFLSSPIWLVYRDEDFEEAKKIARDGAIREVEAKRCLKCRRYKGCKEKKVYCKKFKKIAEKLFLELFRIEANFPLSALVTCPNCGQGYHIRSTYSQLVFVKKKTYLNRFFQVGKAKLLNPELEPEVPVITQIGKKKATGFSWVKR